MTIRFNLNCELTINDLELQELECVHNHGHEDHGDKHCHHCGDDNSLGSLKGSANLKFDCGVDFDMSPEEMKSCYNMIESLGGKFAETARRTRDLGERVVTKINQAETKKPKPIEDKVESEDQADNVSIEIELKSLLKQATELISEEEGKLEPNIEQLDWANVKLKSVARKCRRAALDGIIIDSTLDAEYGELKKRLAALNEKC